MTNGIARWHSNALRSGCQLESAYADKLEAEMQELAIQLHEVSYKFIAKGVNQLVRFFFESNTCLVNVLE